MGVGGCRIGVRGDLQLGELVLGVRRCQWVVSDDGGTGLKEPASEREGG